MTEFVRILARFYSLMLALVLLALIALIAVGCTPPRTVTVPGETPPPTVVTVRPPATDLAVAPANPATGPLLIFRDRIVRDTVETQPLDIVRYPERRDTTRAFRIYSVSVDSARIGLATDSVDYSFASPAKGETTRVFWRGDSLVAVVEGEPAKEPDREVEVPGCPTCLIETDFMGILYFAGSLLFAAGVGYVVGKLS